MSDYQQNQQKSDYPQKVKTILDHWGFKLTAKPINGSQRKPTLAVSISKNQPNFTVYTNLEGDKENGRITAKTDTATFFTIIQALDRVIKGPNDQRFTCELKDFKFLGGGRKSETPMLDSKIVVGKDQNGIIYIAVVSWDQSRPTIRFPFQISEKANLITASGEPVSPSETSAMVAETYRKLLWEMIPDMLRTQYVEDKPRTQQNKGPDNRSGYSQQRSGQQNRGGFDDTFGDDDIPL